MRDIMTAVDALFGIGRDEMDAAQVLNSVHDDADADMASPLRDIRAVHVHDACDWNQDATPLLIVGTHPGMTIADAAWFADRAQIVSNGHQNEGQSNRFEAEAAFCRRAADELASKGFVVALRDDAGKRGTYFPVGYRADIRDDVLHVRTIYDT